MDEFMDTLWSNIMAAVQYAASLFDQLLSPFHVFGPIFVITLLAFMTVLITKLLNKIIITKRYTELEKEFQHWFKIREEAMKGDDYDRSKRLARNIDQAKLNRVYYDYFLEGFLLGLVRNVLPIFLMVAYINEHYRPEELNRLFGRDYMLSFSSTSSEPILVGSIFYFICTLLLTYLAWFVIKKTAGRFFGKTQEVVVQDYPLRD